MTISTELIVPATLWALLAFSVATWSLILVKAVQHVRLSRHNRRFTKAFWSAANLQTAADLAQASDGPAARLSAAGLQVLREDSETGSDLEHTGDRQDLLERALRQQIHKERRQLESGLAVLASIGSTSPFVGLFGTVWGIMHALTDIGKTGSASLDVVAGPIGEALIATGVGIAVAVPAVLAYNFFLRRLKVTGADLDELGADLISLSRKSGYRIPRGKAQATAAQATTVPHERIPTTFDPALIPPGLVA
ncbi:MAG: MotA/TolQ/ExbB proton channel family protein [Pseudomonadota bacterium]